jgi:DNA-nicking Smr family endonuclease
MRRPRSLSEEERALWATISRTATPLGKPRRNGLDEDAPISAPPVAAAKPLASARKAPVPEAAPPPVRPSLMPSYQAPGPGGPSAPFHPIERPVRRKIAKGRLPIEARIDLHDRTQVVAHYVLLGFLRQAQAQGLRMVLVITGRGASFGSRGVIRRQLPHWFDTPEFRPLVSGFEPAEREHGGDGAFYVRVRRR